TNDTLQPALTTSLKPHGCRRRIMALINPPLAATAAVLIGLVSLANGAMVSNGAFEIEGIGPNDALSWTGENGTTIIRTPTGGVSGSAGGVKTQQTPPPRARSVNHS